MNNTLKLTLASVLCLLVLCLAPASAQTSDNPISAGQKGLYAMVKNNLIRGAEKMPEENYSFKADLVQALKDALAYCDKAFDGLTDAQAAQTVKFFGRDQAKATVLSFNTMHNMEHYGNMVTYLRLKGLVPPTSEARH